MPDRLWTCPHCQSEQTHEVWCEACQRDRFPSWDIMVSEHVLEHLAEGLVAPLDIQKKLNERPCYKRINSGQGFDLAYVTRRVQMLTRDTTKIADQLAKALSAPAMLRVFKEGKPQDLIQAMAKWGPKVNVERVEHSGEVSVIERLTAARKRAAAAKESK